jgi:pyruvate dehydrogenase E1 component alpha subunit
MHLARIFDEKCIALQRTGRLGTFASSLGQEAVAVGTASAMAGEDVFLPSFRESGAQLWRGVRPEELFLFWGGDERGNDYAGPREDFPICVPVATHFPHAAGVALAFQTRGEKRCAVAVAGDGATSKGDFYEAMNVVGAWELPAVFVIADNQWAISVPRSAQSACPTLAQKAIAAGVWGVQVDGNDVIAVRDTVEEAIERARKGDGGSLIECLTYRLGDHTTVDDASRYRQPEAVSDAWKREPIARLRTHLTDNHGWTRQEEESLREGCRKRVDEAAQIYLALSPMPPSSMFDHLFADLPADLEAQRQSLIEDGND